MCGIVAAETPGQLRFRRDGAVLKRKQKEAPLAWYGRAREDEPIQGSLSLRTGACGRCRTGSAE